MNKLCVSIVGGDLRFVRLAQILCQKEFKVLVFGLCHPDLPKDAIICSSIDEIKDCPFIIGPIPFSKDGKSVFTPMCNSYVSIEQFFLVAANSFVLGSVLKPNIRTLFEKHHINYCDIFDMDEIAILNAILTQVRSRHQIRDFLPNSSRDIFSPSHSIFSTTDLISALFCCIDNSSVFVSSILSFLSAELIICMLRVCIF